MKNEVQAPHAVMDTSVHPPVMRCLHCGEVSVLRLPLSLGEVVKKTKAFTDLHEDCKAVTK